jgi:phosphate uptake regulator
MESRKIQLVGNRSYSVSLPKSWVLANKLKPKDAVFFEEVNNDLYIRTVDRSKDASEVQAFNIDRIDNVKEFLVFCYVKNIDKVKLFTKKSDYKKIATIRKVLRYLEGYEVTNEDEKSIEIAFLFGGININVQNVMRRMSYLLHFQFSSVQKRDEATIADTEITIDRLYHMGRRILFSCVNDKKLRQENRISNHEDIFFYLSIVKKLENFGDTIRRLIHRKLTKREVKYVAGMLTFIDEIVVRSLSTKDEKKKLKELGEQADEEKIGYTMARLYHLCESIFNNMVSIEFNREYFNSQGHH